MAQFEQWFSQDLTEKIEIRHCESVMFSGDDKGVVVGVHLFNGGAAYSGGGTVSGKVIRSDGAEVALTGTISGNDVSVELLESCLAVPGPIGVYIRLTTNSQKATVLSAVYTVQATSTGTIVDPGTIIPSVNDLIDDIEQAVSSIPADYTALLAAVAPTFSTTAQYHAGYYVWYNGELYQYKTNHDAGSWDAAQAVKVPLSKAVGEMQDEARIYQYLTNNGQYTVTSADMENGAWSYSSKVSNTKRVRNANLIPVRAGMQIAYSTPTLRLGFWVLASKTASGSFSQEIGFQAAGSSGVINITADGYLIILADSTNNITVADYDCRVTICSLNSKLNSFDLINGTLTQASSSMNGVTFAWNAGKCTVSTAAGSASTAIAVNVMQNRALLPVNVPAGETLYVKYTASISGKVYFRIIFYDSENTIVKTYKCYEDKEITVPDNATQWNLALGVESGVTINPAVVVSDCKILNAKTNKYISEHLFEKYVPNESTFSVWDMPKLSYWKGYKTYFQNSVDIADKLTDYTTYEIISLDGFVYIADGVHNQLFCGLRRASDFRQFWANFSTNPDNVMMTRGVLADGTDFNDVKQIGCYSVNSAFSYVNSPFDAGSGGTVHVFPGTANTILQLAITTIGVARVRTAVLGSFAGRQWQSISGGGTTNNYTFNEYQNTYTVTATPTITTDTNAYLAPSGDTSDRTADIVTMLNSYGVCRLGKGDYYVSNLQMPENTGIIGCGRASRIILSGTSDGFAIKMGSMCVVSNVAIYGATSSITPAETIGGRHGILWQGTATQNSVAPTESMISDVVIRNFSGGGITCYDTGVGTHNGLLVTNADIVLCGAGINIAYYSEFNKFTNVRAYNCYYGCIDNGGNNNFANCDFSSNTIGLLIDNSTDQSPNNTHGSLVGCTFNHSGGNTGTAIRILGGNAGEVFTASQIFYGKIEIENSVGIRFIGANFGRQTDISVSGSTTVIFSDCTFRELGNTYFTGNNNVNVKFQNCYYRNGTQYPENGEIRPAGT